MRNLWITKTYDIRPIDFQTGKRIPVATSAMKTCQCCGKHIVKVNVLNNGKEIGSECATAIDILGGFSPEDRNNSKVLFFWRISQVQVDFYNAQ